MADGVVVHNCRSIVTPWLHGEGRAPEQTYRDWFLSQPRAIQEATTFGPTRRRLLREGIPPERMVTRELRPLSVRELEALELRLEGG